MKALELFLRLTLDTVTVQVEGVRPEYFASLCAQQGVQLGGMRAVTGGFVARLPARDFFALPPLARRCRVRVHIVKKSGPAFRLYRYRRRWGLFVGVLLFTLCVRLGTQMIWSIRFVDADAGLQNELRAELAEYELYAGALASEEKLARAERALLDERGDLGWVSLNFFAGRLVVETNPAELAPAAPPSWECDLVAATDATILQTNIQSGFLQKSVGQTVAQGEILVSASQLDYFENLIVRPTMGSVTGRVERTYQCTQPLESESRALTGRLQTRRALRFLGRSLPLFDRQPPEGDFELVGRQVQAVECLGFALPVTCVEELWAQRQLRTLRMSKAAAEATARYACRRQLYSEFPDAEIRSESWQTDWQDDACRCTLWVQFDADIARPAQ